MPQMGAIGIDEEEQEEEEEKEKKKKTKKSPEVIYNDRPSKINATLIQVIYFFFSF
jgi:hypothetical protein